MKKKDFKKLALMGVTGGMMIAAQAPVQAEAHDSKSTATYSTSKILSESEVLSKLDAEGKSIYQGLSPEGKALAIKLVSYDCKGKNDCKGLNACDTATNDCAGMSGCRGTTPGPFKNKNLAIKVAAQRMAEKRYQIKNEKN